jgi:hypothetical protein
MMRDIKMMAMTGADMSGDDDLIEMNYLASISNQQESIEPRIGIRLGLLCGICLICLAIYSL